MAIQVQIRRDTAANWTAVDPILAEGEIGIELVTGKFKIGDGTNLWSALAYNADDQFHNATATTAMEDTDEMGLWDSLTQSFLKITWANIKATLKTYFDTLYPSRDGWQAVSDSWAYASASTITVPSGAALLYTKGDKIKLTQTTVKYFSVISVADTVLTVTGGTDYTVANAAISAVSVSHIENPIGFPAYFNWQITWDLTTSDNGSGATPARAALFKISGNFCWLKFGDQTATWKKVGANNTITITGEPVPHADSYTGIGVFSSEQGGATVKGCTVRTRGVDTIIIESNDTIVDNNLLYGSASVNYRI